MFFKRLKRDLEDLAKLKSANFSAGPVNPERDLSEWKASFMGPQKSPYSHGVFCLDIQFPKDYPFKAPQVKFITKIYHPNINEKGEFHLDILGREWSPAITIPKLMDAVFSLLEKPNASDAAVKEIAEQYNTNKKAFENTAAEWTLKYAC
eukprot:TRINITY_DN725_c0_g1_i1.p1 TRINITY_DN725_c0_g1~~TRINITY_DN725_c0_g1_i1.p1  ORF type:complete len:150 (-),score=32.59 TRINITY_DN725_c0_g1_i1:139-588(-)